VRPKSYRLLQLDGDRSFNASPVVQDPASLRFFHAPPVSRSRYNRGMMRILGLLFGIPILLIGAMWIAIDVGLSSNANRRTFPLMTICAAPCVWLGYRLVFTKPVRSSLPRLKPPNPPARMPA